MDFVKINPGQFTMGSPTTDPDHFIDEGPVVVEIPDPFEIGKHLVTQNDWETVMGFNPSDFRGPTHPVETVSWDDTQEFIAKLDARDDGYIYRLPTEAEWEYCCRAGTASRFYWGDDYGLAGQNCWYFRNSGGTTHPVGEKLGNQWGLYDMQGNVSEWVQDHYDKDLIGGKDPVQDDGRFRVTRGADWNTEGEMNFRSCNRHYGRQGGKGHDVGFRLVRTTL